MMTATYSPEDNKLRLYASARLDAETYAKVKAAGFIWAPRQDLFVAPMWTPAREDLLLELCGEIDDEDTSLVDRQEQRAERFEGYEAHRARDAESARKAVDAIADHIPFGQPILVGHHSEKRARRDAEKIRNGMERAVRMWNTSEYWQRRAAGAIRHAKYKELPAVRARRIKTLEADQRKWKRGLEESERWATGWEKLTDPESVKRGGQPVTFVERVRYVASRGIGCRYDLDGDIEAGKISAEEAHASVVMDLRARATSCSRWVAQLDNRLTYERAMLEASGWVPPPKPKTDADLPLLNYSGEVAYRCRWRDGEITRTTAHPMTKAELAAIDSNYKGTRVSEDGTHRLRIAMIRTPRKADGGLGEHGLKDVIVFLTDSKVHDRPGEEARRAAAEAEDEAAAEREAALDVAARRKLAGQKAAATRRAAREQKAAPFEAMKQSLKNGGVQVVAAPQLFPTPSELAQQMARELGVQNGDRVLEPSAGTGALLRALFAASDSLVLGAVVAVEIETRLADAIEATWNVDVKCDDFLRLTANDLGGKFDRILMNPPFKNGQDLAHINHALSMLKPGGRLVAICADGSLRADEFAHRGSYVSLPSGSFASQGTNVNVAMLVIDSASGQEGRRAS